MDHPTGFLAVGRVRARRAFWFPERVRGKFLLSGFPDPPAVRVGSEATRRKEIMR